jgi:hypothetical protein
MYNIVPWSADLDLDEFYSECKKRGRHNNASQSIMIDAFDGYSEKQFWIIYFEGRPVGCFGAHRIDEFPTISYRMGVRACILSDRAGIQHIRTRNQIATHQNIISQFAIPQCVEWISGKGTIFITTHPSDVGAQRAMHNIGAPTYAALGILDHFGDIMYQNKLQTFWQLDIDQFNDQIDQFPRWRKIFSEKPLTDEQLKLYNDV